MHAERRLQSGQHRRPFGCRDEPRHVAMPGDVIAEHDDDVSPERIGAFDDAVNAIERHPGIAGMEIGDDGDRQLEIGRPSRR